MSERRVRVLIAKVGLDGHDRGAQVVARALRDGGTAVVYTGLMRAAGATDILLAGGGVIPAEDVPALRAMGVADVILQEATPDSIVTRLRDLVAARQPR